MEFSPFDETKLACSCAQNFGIIGTGKQSVFTVKNNTVTPLISFDTRDGVYDCTWSEMVDTHLAFASGDGSVRIWDIKTNKILRLFEEHTAEVYSVDWNLVTKVHTRHTA